MAALEILQAFFPSLVVAVESVVPGTAVWLLPPGPSPTLSLLGLTVRLPLLVLLAALGAAIGLAGYQYLRRYASSSPLPAQSVWAMAFLYFAGMNTSAIMCHCLLPNGQLRVVFGALDVAFTGCSSACLAWASLAGRPQPSNSSTRWLLCNHWLAGWIWVPVIASVLAGNLALPGTLLFGNETVYLITTFAAAAILYVQEARKAPRHTAEAAHMRVLTWAALMAHAALLHGPLDKLSHGWFNAFHVAFLACDVAFAALLLYLEAKRVRLAKGA